MGKKEEIKKEDVIQAVVVADSFSTSFNPITQKTPSCLLPLAGRPLLEYTFQCLSLSQVQDVILYLTTNSAKVKAWLNSSAWSSTRAAAPFTVTCITNEECRSFGDAMRDLDEKGLLRNDFLLVTGDLVSNIDLRSFLNGHKEKAAVDKRCIMTGVYMQAPQGHPLRCKGKEPLIVTDRKNNQILFYQKQKKVTSQAVARSTQLPVEIFTHDEVELMYDAMDPMIYVCSPTVLALFSDNFDIQDMDTLMNEIIESELVDSTLYMATPDKGFACRVENPYLYLAVAQKYLRGWLYPFTPSSERGTRFGGKLIQLKNSVFRAKTADLRKNVSVYGDTYLGSGVVINDGAKIESSILETGSQIGAGTQVSGSYVMQGCNIGAGCSLKDCVIGENVTIADNVTIEGKVIIGPTVEVAPPAGGQLVLRSGTRLAAEKQEDAGFSDEEDEESGTNDAADCAFGPRAFLYKEEEEDDEDDFEDDDFKDSPAVEGGDVLWWGVPASRWEDEDEDVLLDFSLSGSEDERSGDEEDSDGLMEASDEDRDNGFEEHEDVKNFRREVTDSLARAAAEGVNTDNLVLEINGSKHAWNTTLSEVNHCVLTSILTLGIDTDEMSSLPPVKLLATVKVNIVKFRGLLVKYSKSKSGQDYYLASIVDLVTRFNPYLEIIGKVLHILYECDVLSDTAILAWSEKLSSQDTKAKELLPKIQPFLDWLDDDDDSSSGEDD